MEEKEIIERLVKNEESVKSAYHRLDTLERKIENIQELTVAVKEIAMETKATREDVNDMNNRLKKVEDKPAQNWDKLVWIIITRSCNCNSGFFVWKIWIKVRR